MLLIWLMTAIDFFPSPHSVLSRVCFCGISILKDRNCWILETKCAIWFQKKKKSIIIIIIITSLLLVLSPFSSLFILIPRCFKVCIHSPLWTETTKFSSRSVASEHFEFPLIADTFHRITGFFLCLKRLLKLLNPTIRPAPLVCSQLSHVPRCHIQKFF